MEINKIWTRSSEMKVTKLLLDIHTCGWVIIIKYWSDWKKLFTEHVLLLQIYQEHVQTRCVCETQMPPIMANSKDGQGHKD